MIEQDKNLQKRSKVVLVDPVKYPRGAGIVSAGKLYVDEPLGLLYVAAHIAQQGYAPKVFQQGTTPDERFIGSILAEQPDVVGLTAMTASINPALMVAEQIKHASPRTKTVLGGIHATSNTHLVERSSIDYIIRGEGEMPFSELVQALDLGEPVDGIRGLVFKKDGRAIVNPSQDRLSQEYLDSIDYKVVRGFFDHLVLPVKSPLPIPASETRGVDVSGSRGCLYNCKYCSSPVVWQRRFVSRTPGNVVDEIAHLIATRGANTVFFRDEDVFSDPGYIEGIAEEILSRGIKKDHPDFQFLVMAGINSVLRNKDILPLLKKAGCESIAYGIESLDNNQLKFLGKSQNTVAKAKEVFNATVAHGIRAAAYLMIGNAGETEESLEQAYQTLKELPFNRLRVAITTPFPGTRLYDEVTEQGLWIPGMNDNFDLYTAEHPMIRSDVPPERVRYWQEKLYSLHFTDSYFETMKHHIMRDADPKRTIKSYMESLEGIRRFGIGRLGEVPYDVIQERLGSLSRNL